MSDSTSANYSRIGLVIVFGVAAIVATLIFLGGMGNKGKEVAAETFFTSPVSGLAVGSDVNFRGVKVGTVKKISFIACEYDDAADEDGQTIWVSLAIDPDLCGFDESDGRPKDVMKEIVARGLHATVAANILTGIAHIELNFPKSEVKELPMSWNPRSINIPPAPTILESAQDIIPAVLSKFEKADFAGAWTNVIGTVGTVNTLLGNANTLIETQSGNISEILGNLRDASSALRDFATTIKDNPSLLLRSRDAKPLPETSL